MEIFILIEKILNVNHINVFNNMILVPRTNPVLQNVQQQNNRSCTVYMNQCKEYLYIKPVSTVEDEVIQYIYGRTGKSQLDDMALSTYGAI